MKTDPNTQLAAVIDREAPNTRIVAALAAALSADLVARDGTRQPDHRTRLDAAKVLLAYTVGTPITRSEIISVDASADSAAGLQDRLRKSPSLVAKLKMEIERAEGQVLDV